MNIKKLLPQLLTLLVVILIFGFFSYNAQVNMENRGITFGYGFLSQESSFDVQFSLIEFDGSHSYFRAYLVGLLNTILVSVIGIIFATIIGIVVGIARLSNNYLIERTAAVYVEFFRNIPLLLQIFFWYFAALRALPLPQDAEPMFGVFFLTIKGFFVPAFVWNNLDIFIYSVIAALISIIFIRIYARKKQEKDGVQTPVLSISIGLLLILPILSFLFGGVDTSIEVPVIKQLSQSGFTYEGGIKLPPELISLALALSLYTATFIAECVRAGVQGVSKGQKEAAASIGLTPNQVLKLVVMPQALRIIIPPTTNQYLNLTKNSSLAAAIAYPDLVLVFAGTALMQTGRAIEIVSITMLTYLSLSISISIFMNWYNKKIAIKEK
ncbi:ABC transporter permease subunit [Pelagibacterales bacterium SAG-MED25]|uniref:amino acid ABC transporter permease n=1 Tax=Pelagibacter sp. (strain HTCC7211) TaxID=439493 RepID=UPI000552031F|nr:ABC transporter permease subunit [Candidatus Pelagibacter sp. HTCC7211]MBD1150972.1 ABC transporter permease subunit [Pelagibacterales bacterium SAG-MED25]